MKYKNNINGLVLINKPQGLTSRDVVNIIQKKLNTKAGHTGTLDPLAEGVLVVCLGKATKLSQMLTSDNKEYIAEVTMGLETDTLDSEGTILKETNAQMPKEEIVKALNHFKTTYYQEVPKYSAVKVNGKKLYEYARNNEEVTLPKKEVTIYDIKLLDHQIKDNKTIFTMYTKVSKGTYIRSLIRDICHYLKTVGIMTKLTRTSQGQFELKDTYTLIDINNGNYQIIPIEKAINLPIIQVDDKLKFKIINGQILDGYSKDVLFIDKDNKPLAIYTNKDNKFRPKVMLYEAK